MTGWIIGPMARVDDDDPGWTGAVATVRDPRSLCPTPVEMGVYRDDRHVAVFPYGSGRNIRCRGCGCLLRDGGDDMRWWFDLYLIEEEAW